jgi:1,4-alpha-glucan branching enzyme
MVTAPSLLSEEDLYLFGEGTWLRAYEKLGAHPRVVDGRPGVNLAVWAPGAAGVSVVGDFNSWQAGATPMAPRGTGGVWETFVPELKVGDLYKYAIRSKFRHYQTVKADPYAFYGEVRPATASIVCDLSGYDWGDAEWLAARERTDHMARPIAVYEVHAGSWRRKPDGSFLSYRELAHQLVEYVRDLGFTHIELLPITEHPFDQSFGYQTTGYYAPTSRFGTPHDFMYFVDYCHRHGIGIFVDWVPSHFAKEGHGLGFFDGTHLYEHADPRLGEHLGWGTFVFNYSRHEVLTFLLSNAFYWLQEYHIDGFRVDAVASMLYLDYDRGPGAWVPNRYGGRENLEAIDFLRRFNDMVHSSHPGVLTSAEESTAWPGVTHATAEGGLGFDLKWNMGWMHDTLAYLQRDPIYRRYHQNEITFSYTYAFSECYILPLSHDEVIHLKHALVNKMPGDEWRRMASLRSLYAAMYAHPGKKLLFMGGEFAQHREWAYAEALEWYLLEGEGGLAHRQIQQFVTELNRLYAAEPALHHFDTRPGGFAWIDGSDTDNSVIAVLRRGPGPRDVIAMVCNFTPVVREAYPIGVPLSGRWIELLNSDEERFGGSGVGNGKGLKAEKQPLDGYEYALRVTLPPLGVLWLQPAPPAGHRGSAKQ